MQLFGEESKDNLKSAENTYDVVVVGLGTAGAISLVAAARKGLKVLGVEERSAMGGVGTLGAVGNYYYGSSGGIYEEINRKTKEIEHELYSEFSSFRMDAKAYVLENEAVMAGAELLYDSTVAKVYLEGSKAVGLRVLQNGENIDINSKIIIDATGEAHVCRLAGCKTYCGRDFDGQTQTFTNAAITFKDGILQNGMNMDAGFVLQNDCMDLSRAIVDSLSQYNDIYVNAYKDRVFVTNASILGVREGRHILGEEQLKLSEFMENNYVTEKPLFFAFSNLDSHCKDMVFEDEIINDWMVVCGLWGVLFSVGVPMGPVIPKGYDGLLVAGRCLSCDHNFSSCIRMKKDMEKCGEAVAMIAYLSIKNNCKTKDVDYKELEGLLKETGCLSHDNNCGLFHRTLKFGGKIPCSFLTDINEIKKQLSSNSPGIAIWSVKRLGNKTADLLADWLNGDDENLKKHTAFALALISDRRACKLLRQMVEERDGMIPSSSIKYTFTRCNTAIYLLGRLGDKEAVTILYDIIKNNGCFDKLKFVPDEFYQSAEELQTQYVVYAVRALVDIAEKNPDIALEIKENLRKLVVDSNLSLKVTLKSSPNVECDLTEKIINYISIKHIGL